MLCLTFNWFLGFLLYSKLQLDFFVFYWILNNGRNVAFIYHNLRQSLLNNLHEMIWSWEFKQISVNYGIRHDIVIETTSFVLLCCYPWLQQQINRKLQKQFHVKWIKRALNWPKFLIWIEEKMKKNGSRGNRIRNFHLSNTPGAERYVPLDRLNRIPNCTKRKLMSHLWTHSSLFQLY